MALTKKAPAKKKVAVKDPRAGTAGDMVQKAIPGRLRRGLKLKAPAAPAPKTKDPTINVTSGTYNKHLPVVGKTIADVAKQYADQLDLHPESVAVVNGDVQKPGYTIADTDTLIFVRPSGQKGDA